MTEWLDIGLVVDDDEDIIITAQVCVTQLLSPEGTRFVVDTRGDSQISTLLGLLAMGAHEILLENDQEAEAE